MTITLDAIRVQSFTASMSTDPLQDSASVVLLLPNGVQVRADIQAKDVSRILCALQPVYQQHVAAHTPELAHNEPTTQEALEEAGATEVRLQWVELPDQILPAHVKYAMALDLDLPELLTHSQVVQIRDRIVEDYTEIQWNSLAAKVKANQDAAIGDALVHVADERMYLAKGARGGRTSS